MSNAPPHCRSVPGCCWVVPPSGSVDGEEEFSGELQEAIFLCSSNLFMRLNVVMNGWSVQLVTEFRVPECVAICVAIIKHF
jgi:hypothetical protein